MSDLMRDGAKEQSSEHGFIVHERAHVEIKGMTEVISFDENSVVLATTGGRMLIEGRELRVGELDVKDGNERAFARMVRPSVPLIVVHGGIAECTGSYAGVLLFERGRSGGDLGACKGLLFENEYRTIKGRKTPQRASTAATEAMAGKDIEKR